MLRILILTLALGAGGAAAWMAYAAITEAPDEAPAPVEVAAPAAPSHEILVAAGEIALGDALSAEHLEWRAWPEDGLDDAYIQRAARPEARDKVIGALARSRFTAGEPILENKLVAGGAGFLAALLASGERAVAVRISAENTAGGFILPGDRVDVLHTSGDGDGDGVVTRAILGNVEVLAIDQIAVEAEAETEAVVGKTATLRVTGEQAERLTAAKTTGQLSLALRAAADRGAPTLTEAPEPAPEPEEANVHRTLIRVHRNGATETVEVQ